MAQAWQTVEEAALTLGISVRTLHRRIAKGELQSRLEAGRREVFVEIPDPEPIPSDLRDAENDVFESSAKTVSQQSVGIHPDMHNTMLQLHEDRLRRTDLAILAYQQSVMTAAAEARRSRIMARVAWATVGVAVAGLFTIGVWSTQKLSSAEAEVITVKRELRSVESDADAKAAELEKLKNEATTARLAAARAEGELKAKAEPIRVIQEVQPAPAPTTQPSSLVGKLFSTLATD